MTVADKLITFKSKGWTYNGITGTIYSHKGKPIKDHLCRLNIKEPVKEVIQITNHTLAWYLITGEHADPIYHKDLDKKNLKWNNLTLVSPYEKTYVNRPPGYYNYYNRKEKVVSVKNTSQKEPFKRSKYLNDIELKYEILISQAKGKLTTKGQSMLIRIGEEIIKKFSYRNEDDRYDCQMNGIYQMLTNWKKFNCEKYDSALPYFSEVAKRGIAAQLAQLKGKQGSNTYIPGFVSIDTMYNF